MFTINLNTKKVLYFHFIVRLMKKILLISGLSLIALMLLLIIVPFFFKDKISAVFKEKINNQINGQINYGDFSLSVIKTFPHFDFTVNDLTLGTPGDTLLQFKKVHFVIDLLSVWRGQEYKIIRLSLEEPKILARIDENGKTNWDILKKEPPKTEETKTTPLKLEIRDYRIENGFIQFQDVPGKINFRLNGVSYSGNGKMNGTNSIFNHLLEIDETDAGKGLVQYLSKTKIFLKMTTELEGEKAKYTIKEGTIKLNELQIDASGYVIPGDSSSDMDIKLSTPQTSFKDILSMIPAFYQKDFAEIKSDGFFAFTGSIKGTMKGEDFPSLDVRANIDNGSLRYPSLPSAVQDIQLRVAITKNQGALDNMTIDLSKLHLAIGGNPVDGKMLLKTPLSDPDLRCELKGKLDLATIQKLYPMDNIKQLKGDAVANLQLIAKKSNLINKKYDQIQANGTLQLSNMVYEDVSGKKPASVENLALQFTPKNVTINSCKASSGSTRIEATGSIDNFMEYMLGEDTLFAHLNLACNQIIAREWMSETDSTKKNVKTKASGYIEIPGNIDFKGKANISLLQYDDIRLNDVEAEWRIEGSRLTFDNLSAKTMGGYVKMKGMYDTSKKNQPRAEITYAMQNMDIRQVYDQVKMAEKMAPVMKHLNGTMQSDIQLNMNLNPDMNIDFNTLSGQGSVSVAPLKIVDLPLLNQIGQVARVPMLQNPEIKNVKLSVLIRSGKLIVQPFDVPFGNGYKLNVQGSNSFDKQIDYSIRLDVPGNELGQATSLIQQYIPPIPGVVFKMPETVNFHLKATGPFNKPKVTIEKITADGKSSIKDAIADRLKEEAKRLEEEAMKRAREEAERLQREALDKAKTEGERLKKEAEKRAKEAAEKAKKEAEKGLRDIFKFPK